VPSIHHISEPYLDDRGFWLDLDVEYSGGFCLSMETKCNLMRLKYASSMTSTSVNDEAASAVKLGRSVCYYVIQVVQLVSLSLTVLVVIFLFCFFVGIMALARFYCIHDQHCGRLCF